MRAEDVPSVLADAAGRVRPAPMPVREGVRRRRRRAIGVRAAAAVAAVSAVVVAVAVGPTRTGGGAAPARPTTPATTAPSRGLQLPGAASSVIAVGQGQFAVHDTRTGVVTVTSVPRLGGAVNGAASVGPWVVVSTGNGPAARASAINTEDPSAIRRLGTASVVVPATTSGLVWLQDSDGQAREVTLGGLQATASVRLDGTLVAASDAGLLAFTRSGAAVVDPTTGGVSWALPDAVPLAAHGRTVAWCTSTCADVDVAEIGRPPTVLPGPPNARDAYHGPAAFSPDGRYLAVAYGTAVVVHDVEAGSTPAILAAAGGPIRSLTWAGSWLVVTDGNSVTAADAPSFAASATAPAGISALALAAAQETPEAAPSLVAGSALSGDGWFVRAGVRSFDHVPEVCFGVFGPPLVECLPAAGAAVEAGVIGSGDRQGLVGVVADPRIATVRLTTTAGTVDDGVGLVVVDGYRAFGWRGPISGSVEITGLDAAGRVVATATVSTP